ncbi:MAG: helix-turn-helix domain-containing protein [Sulfurimonas sp.]|jgi:predicted transcriptional regulator
MSLSQNNRLKKGDGVPYTQIANEILFSRDLSLKAKGLYAFMYAKPDNWNFTTRSMASQLKEDAKTIQRILRELKEVELTSYQKHSDGTGTYTIYSTFEPKAQNGTLAQTQNPIMPLRQNALKAKCTPINNTDSNKNKDINNNPEQGSKIKLNLSDEAAAFRQKLLTSGYVGHLAPVMVEQREEQAYIDEQGRLYTNRRTIKQIVSSTINEIWSQLHEINESNRAKKDGRDVMSQIHINRIGA